MTDTEMSMPVAAPPAGVDPATFYAAFAGNLTPSWTPTDGLVIWLATDPNIARLYAPVKCAMKFAAAGALVGNAPLSADALLLQTWPIAYAKIKDRFPSTVPMSFVYENVDPAAVRAAVTPLFVAISRNEDAVNEFMAGNGLLRVLAGTPVGAAATGLAPPDAATPNQINIRLFDSNESPVNAVQFFSDAADFASLDKIQHPMLNQLTLEGWVEIIVADASGIPLGSEPYILYLSDETTRTGTTDPSGRIFETALPAGDWALDIPGHPSFEFLDE